MSATRDIVHDFLLSPTNLKLRSKLKIAHAREDIELRFGGVGQIPHAKELEHVYRNFVDAIDYGRWENINRKDWKRAAFVFFWDKEKYLISDKVFNKKYLEWLFSEQSAGIWKRLIYAYLLNFENFDEFKSVFQIWSSYIKEKLNRTDSSKTLDMWKRIDDDFDIFNINGNSERIADAYLNSPSWLDFSNATGLKNELENRGYILSVARNLLKKIHTCELTEITKIRNFFDNDNDFRLPEFRTSLIDGLLIRWEDSNPPDFYRKELKAWLTEKFGDPRMVSRRQSGWAGVNQRSIDVLKKWMVEETLDQFFSIIDELALEGHWKYRKKFWKAYFDADYIRDACVILGSDTQRYAQRAFGNNISAGKITSGPHESNHSVLLIQIDDYVFSEWSHNGKCRAWKKGDRFCPDLHKFTYDASDLKAPSLKIVDYYQQDGISHTGSENYSWQGKLSEFIRRHTGARVEHTKYTISAYD